MHLTDAPLHTRIAAAPVVHDAQRAQRVLGELAQRCRSEPELAALGPLLAAPPVGALLAGIFGASPYLTSLIERHPASLARALLQSPEDRFAALSLELARTV